MMADNQDVQTGSASSEWRQYWLIVLAAFTGYSFHSLIAYSTGLFMQPLSDEFGWSRAQISVGLSIDAVVTILIAPFVGGLMDRFGARLLAITGIAMTGGAVGLFGLATGSSLQWILLWLLYSVVSTGIKSFVWSSGIAGTFDSARGMALGISMCGAAAAQVVGPPLTLSLIDLYGWRAAYVLLGVGWGSLALVVVAMFFKVGPTAPGKARPASVGSEPENGQQGGLTWRQAIRNPDLIRIAASSLITMFLLVAVLIHQVPILVEAGVTRSHAAYLASLSGLAGLAGKVATGWLSDRGNARVVSGVTLAVPAVALLCLLEPFRSPGGIVAAMVVIGYASGAKLQISAYLTSRYAGMRNFGMVFGIIGSLVAAGSGLGPLVAGAVHDTTGSYTSFIFAAIAGSVACGLLIFSLGPYPDWDKPAAEPIPDMEGRPSGACPSTPG